MIGIIPPLYCRPCARSAHCCSGDAPPSPSFSGGPPPLPYPTGRAQDARAANRGVPPPPQSPVCALVDPSAWLGCPPLSTGCVQEACTVVWGLPPSLVAARVKHPHSSFLPSGWPRARNARCPFCSPVPISLLFVPYIPVVYSGMSLFPWGSAATGSPVSSFGASKPYSQVASTPCSDLAPSAPSVCLCVLTSPLSSFSVPYCGLGHVAGSCPLVISSPRLLLLRPLVSRVAGGFPSPPRP